eukprot:6640389-Prymnesium_polylepis.1
MVTTVVGVLLEDCAAEPRPMAVRRNRAASAYPHHLPYMLLCLCTVNETAQLRDGSARKRTVGLTRR